MFTETLADLVQKLREFRNLFIQKGPAYLVTAAEALEKAAEIARMASKFIQDLDERLKSGAPEVQALAQSEHILALHDIQVDFRKDIDEILNSLYTAQAKRGSDEEQTETALSAPLDWRLILADLIVQILNELLKRINK